MSIPHTFNRRRALGALAAAAASTLPISAFSAPRGLGGDAARVVIVGGGFGGATAARYLRALLPGVQVVLVAPAPRFYTCPFSNLYLGGLRSFDSIGHGYEGLRGAGVEVIHAAAQAVDAEKRLVVLDNGQRLSWDRLVLSPGIAMRWGALEGYDEAAAQLAPHAWQAGAQTRLLFEQLRSMPDGGVFVMSIPANPFRCPPGPYERASMVAHYFKQHKPRSKILLLDAKEQFSKQGLFQEGWKRHYGDMIEWVAQSADGEVAAVDAKNRTVHTMFGTEHKADVLNVIPPQKAAAIAEAAGVTDASGWAPIVPNSFASVRVPYVYVLGDATIAAPMPKSAFAANTQAKIAAAHIAADLLGQPAPEPFFANTCYSLIAPAWGISVAGTYGVRGGKFVELPGGGVSLPNASAAYRQQEALLGENWYAAMTGEIWG